MAEGADFANLQVLANEAGAGRLRLNGDAADRCAQACELYADGLETLKLRGQNLVRREAFGSLASAQQLGSKFFDLAVGGDGSFEQVLQQHIDVAMKMQDVFVKAGAAYRNAEDSHAQALGAVGSDL